MPLDAAHERFLSLAIDEALSGVREGHGGPFGAVVVLEGRVLARGHNRVTSSNDPTAHAEVVAIREACCAVGDFKLTGARLYASCEPCPMCLGAIHWALIERVYYAATRADAAVAGFDDALLHAELAAPPTARSLPLQALSHARLREPFEAWSARADRVAY